jgi:hypothetical protein
MVRAVSYHSHASTHEIFERFDGSQTRSKLLTLLLALVLVPPK